MKIQDNLQIQDNYSGLRGKIYVKDAYTGEVLFTRDNLIVDTGKEFVKNKVSNEELSIAMDIIGYFKVGSYDMGSEGLVATAAGDTDLVAEVSVGEGLPAFTYAGNINKMEYYNPATGSYTADQYLVNDTNIVIGKKPLTVDAASATDSVMYKLRITPDDFITSKKINELGLFIISKEFHGSLGVDSITDDTYLEYDYSGGLEVMFSRVTFEPVNMDGSTEYIIEYYIYF